MEIGTKRLADLGIHQSVGNRMTNVIPQRTLLVVKLVIETQIQSPVKYFFLEPRQFLTFTEHLIVHLLYEPGDRSHHVWIGLLRIFSHLGNAFGIIYLHTQVLIEIIHHTLVDMAQRHPTECSGPVFSRRLFNAENIQNYASVG